MKRRKSEGLSSRDISLFCSQFVLILRSAIPLPDGIRAMSENVQDSSGKKLMLKIEQSLEQNGSFYTALTEAGAFPDYMVNMVRIGEKAGKLDDVMDALSSFYERDNKLKSYIRGALLHPLILVLMMAAVISVLIIKVLPVFNEVLLNMGSDMLSASRSVTRFGMAVGICALAVTMILALILVLMLALSGTEAGSQNLLDFVSRFGAARRLSEKIASARFASVMSMLLSSGYDTSQSFDFVVKILTGKNMIGKVEKIRQSVNSGGSLALAIEEAQIFPSVYSSMIHLGAKTGSLDTVMNKLADIYSDDVNDSIGKAVSVIEPAMISVLSIVIGGILLSVMLPLIGIMSSIG